jgi:HSP20 family protein
MSLTRWEPFKDLMTLREAMDRLFEDSFVRTGPRWITAQDGARCDLALDVYDTDEEIVVSAAVPGMGPDDVSITIEGDTLIIRGELPAPMENVNYIVQERSFGTFQRQLRMNIPVDAERAEASFENGVLTLVIPKKEEVKPRTIQVKSKE